MEGLGTVKPPPNTRSKTPEIMWEPRNRDRTLKNPSPHASMVFSRNPKAVKMREVSGFGGQPSPEPPKP